MGSHRLWRAKGLCWALKKRREGEDVPPCRGLPWNRGLHLNPGCWGLGNQRGLDPDWQSFNPGCWGLGNQRGLDPDWQFLNPRCWGLYNQGGLDPDQRLGQDLLRLGQDLLLLAGKCFLEPKLQLGWPCVRDLGQLLEGLHSLNLHLFFLLVQLWQMLLLLAQLGGVTLELLLLAQLRGVT